jgi:hypothetical protein
VKGCLCHSTGLSAKCSHGETSLPQASIVDVGVNVLPIFLLSIITTSTMLLLAVR